MKKRNTAKQQKGFFDLGFSLAVLALSGAVAYTATPDQNDNRAMVQEPQIEVAAYYQEEKENEKQAH